MINWLAWYHDANWPIALYLKDVFLILTRKTRPKKLSGRLRIPESRKIRGAVYSGVRAPNAEIFFGGLGFFFFFLKFRDKKRGHFLKKIGTYKISTKSLQNISGSSHWINVKLLKKEDIFKNFHQIMCKNVDISTEKMWKFFQAHCWYLIKKMSKRIVDGKILIFSERRNKSLVGDEAIFLHTHEKFELVQCALI